MKVNLKRLLKNSNFTLSLSRRFCFARCMFAGFGKAAIGLIVSLLMFAFPVRDASAEQCILAGQEKAAVLAEIVNHFKEFPSISLSFDYKQESPTVKTFKTDDYFIVLDDHRYYSKAINKLHTEADLRADPDSVKQPVERCWNGSIMQIFHHRIGSGSIWDAMKYGGLEQDIFTMFGRGPGGRSWLKRYQERAKGEDYGEKFGEEYEVTYEVTLDDTEKDWVQVSEISKVVFANKEFWQRHVFEFDRAKGFAITRFYLEGNNGSENVERSIDARFEDFRLVNGFYIPFKVIRKAHSQLMDSVQTITVKEAKVNDVFHEELLNGFDFPAGARIYDHILSPDAPIRIGVDEESLESLLKAEVQKARDEIK